jgi:hypothetical protein
MEEKHSCALATGQYGNKLTFNLPIPFFLLLAQYFSRPLAIFLPFSSHFSRISLLKTHDVVEVKVTFR